MSNVDGMDKATRETLQRMRAHAGQAPLKANEEAESEPEQGLDASTASTLRRMRNHVGRARRPS